MEITSFVRRTSGRELTEVRRPGRTTKGPVTVAAAQATDQAAKAKPKAKAKA